MAESSSKFSAARTKMSTADKKNFCREFSADAKRTSGSIRTIQKSIDIKNYYSPPTGAALEGSEVGAIAVAILSIGVTAAGVRQADKGNFAGAGRLNSAGRGLSDAVQSQDVPAGKFCRAYAPFTKFSSPSTDAVWKKYHSIQSC
jgi:hypothetical protein